MPGVVVAGHRRGAGGGGGGVELAPKDAQRQNDPVRAESTQQRGSRRGVRRGTM